DIVVSLGRGAIEAMACGRNVIIYDIHGGDGLINEDNFFEIRKNNFSGRRFRINYNVNKFKEEILKYNPRIGEKLRKLVLRENSKNAILKKIEDIYRDALYYDIEKAVEIKNVCNYEKKLKELLEISKQKDQKISELYQIIRQKVQEIASSNQVIQKKDRDIKVMKSSKFWKLREKYLKLKKILLFADNTRQMVTKPASNYLTSVIITAHNYGKFLKDCIDSVLEQTVKPKEIIVVNDASNDNTDEIVKIYENKVQYFKVDFKDAQKARNFGFSKAIGEYVVFLDSDDYFYEDAIEKMQSEMESNPELNLVYSDRTNFGDETILKNINQASKWSSEKFNYGNLKTHNYIPLPSLIRRKKFKGFDERIKRFQDWDAWLTLLKNGKAKRITEPLYFARFHGKNKTFTVNKYIEKLKILHKHNIIKMARVKDKREKLILERTVNLSKSRIIFLISIQIDISSIKKFLYSVDKYHQNKNFLFYLIKNNQEESNILEITHVLERTGIEYRIVRKYNIDQVVKFVKENSIIPLYDADYLVMFRRSNNPDLANFIPGKEIHALYDCEKDILSVNSLDEINALVLNKRGIGTLIGL
ncbi:MAG: glycosyltransferase, partial [Candidatus Moranbacteria bacterium]|nr:glycosyltransferase [Candidatus Moranbacteria bacterium]